MTLKKVPDAGMLSVLLTQYHIRRGNVTNNFLSPQRRADCIAANSLSYCLEGENLFLVEDRGDYFRLYFDMIHTGQLPQFDMEEKPFVTEIVLRPGDVGMAKAAEAFFCAGFQKALTRIHMKRGVDNPITEEQAVTTAAQCDGNAVMELLRQNFDPFTGCLPNETELLRDIGAGSVYTVSIDGGIAGVLHISADKKGVEVRHLAVHSRYRGEGLATRLLNRCFSIHGGAARLWVSKDNAAAKAFYQKNGFSANGWESYVMIQK